MVYAASKAFTYSNAYQRLKGFLWSYRTDKTRIVFAGHDLKFAQMIIAYFEEHEDYEVRLDKWLGHDVHDEEQSQACLEWADIIFCEWGLGNGVWYSKHKREGQKLIIRLHFQEKDLSFPRNFEVENIDKFIVITPYMLEEFQQQFQFPRHKMIYIDNLIDAQKLNKPKQKDAKFHLGICGVLPARKRLDIAIDIFEELWNQDQRYRLFIKSKLPEDVPWLQGRKAERDYYESVFERINNASWKNSVIFDAHGNDVDQWLTKIGFFLSTSDYEGSHVAVSESIASGAIPVIRAWKGANTIYPKEYIYADIEAMIRAISTSNKSDNKLQSWGISKFDKANLCHRIEQLIKELRQT
ncbi:glycosyltransferase family 1 protein [Listeria grandensis]|uniref:glycosyltransferase family 1 protein n=1 Tax=Listeria grandensis TaxID=1494963 RepID=UPI0004B273FB|nr:glycosyltransferase family 1 protein [Listeria grandensis]